MAHRAWPVIEATSSDLVLAWYEPPTGTDGVLSADSAGTITAYGGNGEFYCSILGYDSGVVSYHLEYLPSPFDPPPTLSGIGGALGVLDVKDASYFFRGVCTITASIDGQVVPNAIQLSVMSNFTPDVHYGPEGTVPIPGPIGS